MAESIADPDRHRAFLNDYYGWARGTYDLTRRYYLLGRDAVLDELARDDWQSLVEIGPGTGRNLERLRRRRPDARYAGVDACDAMLEVARERCPWAAWVHGFAEDVDVQAPLGVAPDRILLSYCLSMVEEPERVLRNLRRQLAPDGLLVLVDFGDSSGLPRPFPGLLRRWLEEFHVSPVDTEWLRGEGAHLRFGRGRYWFSATLGALPVPDRRGHAG